MIGAARTYKNFVHLSPPKWTWILSYMDDQFDIASNQAYLNQAIL